MPRDMEVAHDGVVTARILIVDEDLLLGEALGAVLQKDQGFLVETVVSLQAAIERVSVRGRYDAVLLNFSVADIGGFEGMERVIKANGGAVVLFAPYASRTFVSRAIAVGASGFIPKAPPVRKIGNAIRFVVGGDTFLPSEFALQKDVDHEDFQLKPREMRTLTLLCEGKTNREIGLEILVNETTVKADVRSICKKLGVRNRTEAVVKAMKLGLRFSVV